MGVGSTIIDRFKGLPTAIKGIAIAGGIGIGIYLFAKGEAWVKSYFGTSAASTLQSGLSGLSSLSTPNYGGYSDGGTSTTGGTPPAGSSPIAYTSPPPSSSYPTGSGYISPASITPATVTPPTITTPNTTTTPYTAPIVPKLGPPSTTTTTQPSSLLSQIANSPYTLPIIGAGLITGIVGYLTNYANTALGLTSEFGGVGLPFSSAAQMRQSAQGTVSYLETTPLAPALNAIKNFSYSQITTPLAVAESRLTGQQYTGPPLISVQASGGYTPQFSTPQSNPVQWITPPPQPVVAPPSPPSGGPKAAIHIM
jgi:hypothetical protein